MEETSAEAGRELVRLWRVWRTARQMLYDRGYEILQDELNVPLDEFRDRFADANGFPDRSKMAFSLRPSEDMIVKYSDPPTAARPEPPEPPIGTVWVEFNGDQALGVKTVRAFVQHFSKHNFFTGILISAAPVTAGCHKLAPALHPKVLELFHESDLLVNITMHELVPKHVLLSKEEKMKLLDRYRLKESQLPRIQAADPVARYLGLRRGQVVKIIRKSTTAGRYASYRWCI